MSKKYLWIFGSLGVLSALAGFIVIPSLLSHFAQGGTLHTTRSIVLVFLIQYFMVAIGILLIIEAFIFNYLPGEKRAAQYIMGICFIGVLITISGIVFSPGFIDRKLNLINRIEDFKFALLSNIQLAIIVIGCLIIFLSLLFYRQKILIHKGFGTLMLIIVLLLFLVLIDIFYVNKVYPANIISKPKEYSKVLDLLLGRDILLSDFSPVSHLKLHRTKILKAKYPVIDIHFHLHSSYLTDEDKKILEPENLTKSMDSVGVKTIIGFDAIDSNLDTLLGEYQRKFPGRFLVYSDMLSSNNSRILSDQFIAGLPAKLEKFKQLGMQGIGEFPKDLGLKMRDESGKILPIDDPRLDPFYEKAGELGMPIVWHSTDPTSFWYPVDKYNERYSELREYPFESYYGPQFPSKETILNQVLNVLKKHPNTIIIGAHLGYRMDDLDSLGKILDTYPNFYVECGSTISEIGRQPYTARRFFIKYQDRIMFGTDAGLFTKYWTFEKIYRAYYEFLETDDEYIDYPLKGFQNQGNWEVYGINLPDSVLQKIYYKNAERIFNIK